MKRTLRSCVMGASALLLAALLAPSLIPAQTRPVTLLVLVSATSKLSDIDSSVLRRTFDSYPVTLQGTRLIPLNQPVNTPARVAFDRLVLGLEPAQVGRYWTDRKIRELAAAPKAIPSVDVLLRVIVSLPGAVGYAELAPNAVPAGLKALSISGKKPTAHDYPLRR